MFWVVDHYTAEAWAHLAKTGDRFAALQPVYDAVIARFSGLGADVARMTLSDRKMTSSDGQAAATPAAPGFTGWGAQAAGVRVTV